jgi:hypothetical protein
MDNLLEGPPGLSGINGNNGNGNGDNNNHNDNSNSNDTSNSNGSGSGGSNANNTGNNNNNNNNNNHASRHQVSPRRLAAYWTRLGRQLTAEQVGAVFLRFLFHLHFYYDNNH